MNKILKVIFLIALTLDLSACTSNPSPEPTEPISWSVVEEVGRDGDEVHYRVHSSNGLTVDRYTTEVEE